MHKRLKPGVLSAIHECRVWGYICTCSVLSFCGLRLLVQVGSNLPKFSFKWLVGYYGDPQVSILLLTRPISALSLRWRLWTAYCNSVPVFSIEATLSLSSWNAVLLFAKSLEMYAVAVVPITPTNSSCCINCCSNQAYNCTNTEYEHTSNHWWYNTSTDSCTKWYYGSSSSYDLSSSPPFFFFLAALLLACAANTFFSCKNL